jgi:ATP-dependent Zn protease
MPAEEALARMSAMTIAAAFRAPTTFAVIDRLAEACRPPRTSGDLKLLEGMGALEQAARALVADFIGYQQGHVAWRDMSRSLILNGPPGVGKTFAAGVIAAAAGAHLVTGTVGEWQAAGHLGDMLREMRKTFSVARAETPSILFVDELDGFGSRSDDGDRNQSYRRQVINEFLNLLNGLADQEGCVIIGATNDVSQLDPAIVRPGRFDQIIEVPLPGPTAVAQILRHHVRGDLGAAEVDDLARQARGRTAADIEAAVRAARGRARSERVPLTAAHVAAALAPNSEIPESLSWRIAVHEGGHALVAHLLGVGRVESVRLTPDGGLTTIAPRHSEGLPEDIEAALAYQLGGRAAERLLLGNVGSGSGGPEHSDLARATRAALEAELSLGAGATGLVWLPPDTRHLANPQLRERVSARLEAAEARAFAVLSEVRPALDNLARVLLRERVLEGWSLQLLLNAATEHKDGGTLEKLIFEEEMPLEDKAIDSHQEQIKGTARS